MGNQTKLNELKSIRDDLNKLINEIELEMEIGPKCKSCGNPLTDTEGNYKPCLHFFPSPGFSRFI